MENRQKLTVAIVSSALIVLLAGDVLAGSGRMSRAQHAQRGQPEMERMNNLLTLTEDQQTAIAELQDATRMKNLDLRKQMERVRHELKGEMLKDEPDERTVVQLTERLGKLRTDIRVNRVRTKLAVRAQLTPEQRDELILMRHKGSRFGYHGGEGWRDGSMTRGDCPLHGRGKHPHRGAGRKPGRF